MAKYIEYEGLITAIHTSKHNNPHSNGIVARTHNQEHQHFLSMVMARPAADVVEVKHGEWLLKSNIYKMPDDVDEEFYVECPFCHRTEYVPFELEEEKMLEYAKSEYPYCHCGAKMDG